VRPITRGTVVVITGAGSGIGRATAFAFARRGCRLVLGDLRLDAVHATASRIRDRYASDVVALACDVRSDADVAALIDAAPGHYGSLDVLVNNAGVGYYGRVEDTPIGALRELFDTNVLGVQRGVRAAVPLMRAQARGHIVIVGSVNGKLGWPFHGAYSATKFALTGLTQALRMELAGSGVSASLVLPANVRTRFYAEAAIATPGYEPAPLGPTRSPQSVAGLVVRAVERRSPELNTTGAVRLATVGAEAFPSLHSAAGAWWYRRRWKRIE